MWLHESLDAVADVSLEAFEIAGTSIRRGSSSTTTSVSHRTVNPATSSSASCRAPEILLQWGERSSNRSMARTVTPSERRNSRTSELDAPTVWTTRSSGATPATSESAAYHRNASRWKRGWSSTTQLNRPRGGRDRCVSDVDDSELWYSGKFSGSPSQDSIL